MNFAKELMYKIGRYVPGSKDYTLKAAEIAELKNLPSGSSLLDIGSFTGDAAFVLMEAFDIKLTAINVDTNSTKIIEEKAKNLNKSDKITIYNSSLLELKFEQDSFDAIWSEGVIHKFGFFKGVIYLKKLLKSGGKLVVSEPNWIKDNPPDEVFWFWKEKYPAMTGIQENIKTLEKAGFKNIKHFAMDKEGLWDNYYKLMYNNINYFKQKLVKDSLAQNQLEELETEIDFFLKYGDYYSYVFFIGEK